LRNVTFDSIEQATGLPLIVNRSLDAELTYLMVNNPVYASGGTLILHWGYGIGAAYAYDGRIVKTSFGSFCEIGHLVLNPGNGTKCTCGAIGCLETSAALWALLPEFRRIDPDVPVDEIEFEKYISGKNIERYPFVTKAAEAMGHALAILQTVFLPDRIIVYGPLMSNPEIFKIMMKQAKIVGSNFAVKEINVECSGSNFEGDIIGGTSELFQKAFRLYLTSW
jgi:transcriptional regulator of PTS gene